MLCSKEKPTKNPAIGKEKAGGGTAALLEGACRVGKITIAKEFAKNEYRSSVFADFANVSKSLVSLFDGLSNLGLFFLRLQAEADASLNARDSAIVFDEVQLFPRARQAIRYSVADGWYDYIETGSLISIKRMWAKS